MKKPRTFTPTPTAARHAALLQHFFNTTLWRRIDLARALGVSRGTVDGWFIGQLRVSPERAVEIEKATHGALNRRDFFPNLFE